MISYLHILFLSIAFTCATITGSVSNPIVDLGYIKYEGTRSEVTGVTTWYGIRYATPPVLDLRWRPPQPVHYHNGSEILDATVQGPQCVQGVPAWLVPIKTSIGGQEDCLTVDVLVPNHPTAPSLPVWIEIHGGGYTAGSASNMPGYAMINQSQSLIFVQIQYRLGAFGFLDSDDIRQDGTANAGLLDQRYAMEWVRQHISAFGGDPNRITISGGSAGGGSVTNHLTMYGGVDPPFHAAVPEYPWWQPYHGRSTTDEQYIDLLVNSGCCDLSCLRQLPAEVLANAAQLTFVDGYDRQAYGYGDFYYGPTVDGHIVPDLPSTLFAEGRFAPVPLLTNRETYEGRLFTNASIVSNAEEMDLTVLWPDADQDFFAAIDEIYPTTAFASPFDRVAAIFGDAFINCGTRQIAEAYSRRRIPVWKQIFNAGSQLHAATLPFLFGESADGQTANVNNTLGSIMKDWFISFAIYHDPNRQTFSNISKPHWPVYDHSTVVVVNATTISIDRDPDFNARCDFFAAYGNQILNR